MEMTENDVHPARASHAAAAAAAAQPSNVWFEQANLPVVGVAGRVMVNDPLVPHVRARARRGGPAVAAQAAAARAPDPAHATVSSPSAELFRGSRSGIRTRGSISQGRVTPPPAPLNRGFPSPKIKQKNSKKRSQITDHRKGKYVACRTPDSKETCLWSSLSPSPQ